MKKGEFQVKQLFSVLTIALVCSLMTATAEEILPGAAFSIRYHDRSIYYPGNSPSEPINIQLTITNKGPQTLRFKLADDRSFSLYFTARTTRGQALENAPAWMIKRAANREVYFREVSLEPGESFSIVENLKDYLVITAPGMYVLDCDFYPELKRLSGSSEPSIASNRLTLEIKPSPSAAATSVMPIHPKTAEILKPQAMPPDEVISYILTSRQRSHWDQFFLYLDLDEMIKRDPARKRRFAAESEEGRIAMIDNYKNELSQARIDKDISTIPYKFQIERTTYAGNDGVVTAIEWFQYPTFAEKKRFTYYLVSRDGIWRVVNYTVDNLGTE